jgi:hypothetical protein
MLSGGGDYDRIVMYPFSSSMDKQHKNRLRWRFKRTKQPESPKLPDIAQPQKSSQSSESPRSDCDTQRTRNRNVEACQLLRRSIEACQQENSKDFLEFSDLEGEPASFDQDFLQKVNDMLESWRKDIKDETAWSKCRGIIECIFTTLSPFTKIFLTLANNSQSVFYIHIIHF